MNLMTKIIIIVIALHFVIGIGYLVYKLSPPKDTNKKN
jgi:hypothetical protein